MAWAEGLEWRSRARTGPHTRRDAAEAARRARGQQQPKYRGGSQRDHHRVPLFAQRQSRSERWANDALFRPEVRAAFQQLLAQGWTDAVRELHPGEKIYTFWDYFRNAYGRDAGLRLDHLLLSTSLKKRLLRAGVDRAVRGWDKASDHAPAWIELADAASGSSRPGETRQGNSRKTGR